MSSRITIAFVVSATILLVVGALFMGHVSPKPNQGFTDTAAVLAVITGGAVGIERILEAFWTVMDMTAGAFWPLNLVGRDLQALERTLTEALQPVYAAAERAVADTAQAEHWTEDKVNNAQAEIAAIGAQIAKLQALAPGNLRAQLISTAAQQGIGFLQSKYPAVQDATAVANTTISGISEFIATFNDNPGRRLISIYLGAALGLVGAGFLGLDVFQAILGQTVGGPAHLGVVLTGIVIGLGSNPTHEVIKVLQEIKQSKVAQNAQAAAQTAQIVAQSSQVAARSASQAVLQPA